MLSTAYGFQNLLKEGSRHYSGLEEAILRNINACKEISNMTKTSLGPNGQKKMIVTHIDKLFVTSDAATIMKEMEVHHPAAKLLVLASKMQDEEFGDGTNFVVSFAGELLSQAEQLIKMGLHPSQIVLGYEAAQKKTFEILDSLSSNRCDDITNVDQVAQCLRSSVSSKLYGFEDQFSRIIAEACISTLPENPLNFDVEFVRVAKLLGGSVTNSHVIRGLIVTRDSEGTIKRVQNPKIAVFSCPLDPQTADTKGTILIKNKDELKNYTKSEEAHAENIVKSIAEAGINCIVSGGSISEIILHYCEKYRLMVVKVMSKFELRRICKCLGATPLVRQGAPIPEEIGECDEVTVEEIGSQKCVVFNRDTADCKLSTIVLRGSTTNLLDDIERAIDDGVNVFKNLTKDRKFVPGAGASEMTLSARLETYANTIHGLEQYSINKFAKAFEIIPRILIENAGLNANTLLSTLYSANSADKTAGLDIESGTIKDSSEIPVYDHLKTKIMAISLATEAALTVLRVDQIIVAKPAGGPKPRDTKGWDNDEQ